MSNHVHLLMQVSDIPLGKVVMRIASRYARMFQKQLETTGHLFERRYHAVLVDADAYLLTLVRYIHLNPVRAGLVGDPAHYPWSSHRRYLGGTGMEWVCTDFTHRLLAAGTGRAIDAYVAWMNAADGTRWGEGALATHSENPLVLGSDTFLKRVSSIPPKKEWTNFTLDELLAECSLMFQTTPEAVRSPSRARHLSPARAWLSREALARGIATTSAIARFLNRSETAIRGLMARFPAPDAGQYVR
jgi:hypothetical protein